MASVFLLIHDDRYYDMGDTYVRGVYATEVAATRALVTRTASGKRSQAWGAHTENCCTVDEAEVLDAPKADVREDDPPPTGPGVIPGFVADMIETQITRQYPVWDRLTKKNDG